MNTTRTFWLVKTLCLALLAAGLSPGFAIAQAVSEGKFTLPFDSVWGRKVLPAGDYSFSLESASLPAKVTLRDGTRGNAIAIIMAQGISESKPSDHSALFLLRHGNKGVVRSMYLADLGLVFYYPTRAAGAQLLAQAPELIQRVPISAVGK